MTMRTFKNNHPTQSTDKGMGEDFLLTVSQSWLMSGCIANMCLPHVYSFLCVCQKLLVSVFLRYI